MLLVCFCRTFWTPAAAQRSRAICTWRSLDASPGRSSTCSCDAPASTALLKEHPRWWITAALIEKLLEESECGAYGFPFSADTFCHWSGTKCFVAKLIILRQNSWAKIRTIDTQNQVTFIYIASIHNKGYLITPKYIKKVSTQTLPHKLEHCYSGEVETFSFWGCWHLFPHPPPTGAPAPAAAVRSGGQ